MSGQVYGVSRRKALYKNNEDEVKLEITYSPLSSGGCRRRSVLLLLPQVLLEGGASADGRGAVGLDLPTIGCLLEWV